VKGESQYERGEKMKVEIGGEEQGNKEERNNISYAWACGSLYG